MNTSRLYEWLEKQCEVEWYDRKINLEKIDADKPDLIISYNYKYMIEEDVINRMDGNVINLHISYLPWNKGSNPNFWSFVNDTPKGVTIHKVNSKLDEGDVIFQKKIWMNPSDETFVTSYNKLHDAIVELFIANWESIREKNYLMTPQTKAGSCHKQSDFENLTKKYPISWEENIQEYLNKLNK